METGALQTSPTQGHTALGCSQSQWLVSSQQDGGVTTQGHPRGGATLGCRQRPSEGRTSRGRPATTGSRERGKGGSLPEPPGRNQTRQPPNLGLLASRLRDSTFLLSQVAELVVICNGGPGHSYWTQLQDRVRLKEREVRASKKRLSPVSPPTPLPPAQQEKHVTYRRALGSRETGGSLGSVGSLWIENGQLSTDVLSPVRGGPGDPTMVLLSPWFSEQSLFVLPRTLSPFIPAPRPPPTQQRRSVWGAEGGSLGPRAEGGSRPLRQARDLTPSEGYH